MIKLRGIVVATSTVAAVSLVATPALSDSIICSAPDGALPHIYAQVDGVAGDDERVRIEKLWRDHIGKLGYPNDAYLYCFEVGGTSQAISRT